MNPKTPKNVRKFEPREFPEPTVEQAMAPIPEGPPFDPSKIATEGRNALGRLVELLDSTPGVPIARNGGWLPLAMAIDRELQAGIVNANACGNFKVNPPAPQEEAKAQ